MGIEFEFRHLSRQAYRDLTALLDGVSAGTAESLAALTSRLSTALSSDPRLDPDLISYWNDKVRGLAHATPETATDIASDAVAILCMPEFRNCYLRTLDRPGPPSVVALGADDGGLFALLDERVPWFHSWLIPVLHSRGERYAFGNVSKQPRPG